MRDGNAVNGNFQYHKDYILHVFSPILGCKTCSSTLGRPMPHNGSFATSVFATDGMLTVMAGSVGAELLKHSVPLLEDTQQNIEMTPTAEVVDAGCHGCSQYLPTPHTGFVTLKSATTGTPMAMEGSVGAVWAGNSAPAQTTGQLTTGMTQTEEMEGAEWRGN